MTNLINNKQHSITTTPKHIANCFTKPLTEQHKTYTYHTSCQRGNKRSKNDNSQGPDKLNIMPLEHICSLVLALFTSMLKTALNNNIIPRISKLSNMSPSQGHRQWHLIQAHIPHLGNCKYTGEEPSSLHNRKHSHATRVQNNTVLHT